MPVNTLAFGVGRRVQSRAPEEFQILFPERFGNPGVWLLVRI